MLGPLTDLSSVKKIITKTMLRDDEIRVAMPHEQIVSLAIRRQVVVEVLKLLTSIEEGKGNFTEMLKED